MKKAFVILIVLFCVFPTAIAETASLKNFEILPMMDWVEQSNEYGLLYTKGRYGQTTEMLFVAEFEDEEIGNAFVNYDSTFEDFKEGVLEDGDVIFREIKEESVYYYKVKYLIGKQIVNGSFVTAAYALVPGNNALLSLVYYTIDESHLENDMDWVLAWFVPKEE